MFPSSAIKLTVATLKDGQAMRIPAYAIEVNPDTLQGYVWKNTLEEENVTCLLENIDGKLWVTFPEGTQFDPITEIHKDIEPVYFKGFSSDLVPVFKTFGM